MCAQVALWLYQKSAGYSKSAVTERAAAMLNTSGMDGDVSGPIHDTGVEYLFRCTESDTQLLYFPF